MMRKWMSGVTFTEFIFFFWWSCTCEAVLYCCDPRQRLMCIGSCPWCALSLVFPVLGVPCPWCSLFSVFPILGGLFYSSPSSRDQTGARLPPSACLQYPVLSVFRIYFLRYPLPSLFSSLRVPSSSTPLLLLSPLTAVARRKRQNCIGYSHI